MPVFGTLTTAGRAINVPGDIIDRFRVLAVHADQVAPQVGPIHG
jgi:hypothetical protein